MYDCTPGGANFIGGALENREENSCYLIGRNSYHKKEGDLILSDSP